MSENTLITLEDKKEVKPHIHFLGVGGCGLSALAHIAHTQGYPITGCDITENEYTQKLKENEISIYNGHDVTHIDETIDLVVRSAAVGKESSEIKKAHNLGIPVITHAQFLGILMEGKYGICVAGSHGKTTTDALIGLILKEAQLQPTIEVGGTVSQLGGNYLVGSSRYFVAEACEFDHSFLFLKPNVAIILNIELDHPDFYPDMRSLKNAFIDFLNLVPHDGFIIANDENKEVREVLRRTSSKADIITFGFHKQAEIRIEEERLLENGHWQFQLTGMEKRRKPILAKERTGINVYESALTGKHNILNNTAALIVSDILGVDMQAARAVLSTFTGVARRYEIVDNRYGITVIADYAHHPTQIKATIKAAHKQSFKRLVIIFQPHTYSRTAALFADFGSSFTQADFTFISDTYIPAGRKEKSLKGFTSKDLAQEIGKHQRNVIYSGSLSDTIIKVQEILQIGDGVLLLGAGDIYSIGKEILSRQGKGVL